MTIDTKILNNHILRNSRQSKLDKQMIWGEVLNLSCKALKPQGIDKSMQFRGTIFTDGIAISVVKQNSDTTRGVSSRQLTNKVEEDIDYIDKIPKEDLEATSEKCLFIDPGRRNLLYCMGEKSERNKKIVFRYTRNPRAVETKSKKFRKLRQAYKPQHISECETRLALYSASIQILASL